MSDCVPPLTPSEQKKPRRVGKSTEEVGNSREWDWNPDLSDSK
jgi:hypothetical protein